MKNVLRLVTEPEPAAAPVDPLIAERDRLARLLDRLGAYDAAVGEARTKLENARLAHAAQQEQTQQAFKDWAGRGGEGQPPATDHAKHSAGRHAIERCELELADAISAHTAMSGTLAQAHLAMNQVQLRLDERRVAAITERGKAEVDTLAEIITDVHARYCGLVGLREALLRTSECLRAQNQHERAAIWLNAANSSVGDIHPVTITPNPQTIAASVAEALRKILEGKD